MSDPRVQITLSLSESVLIRIDQLLAQAGMQSRSALIDSLLREVLIDEDQVKDSVELAEAS
jgi:metal-responsive CopG/Arc/MetJ family transcriptional regulator